MILTVTPNFSVDKIYLVENYQLGKIHRPSAAYAFAGGKGINVARVLHNMGNDVLGLGFAGGNIGCLGIELLKKENIPIDFVEIDQESRLCITVVDSSNKVQTEINELGPTISTLAIEEFYNKLNKYLPDAEFMVLSGRCPPSIQADFYSKIIKLCKKENVRVLLDTSGDALKDAVKEAPYIIKPNVNELSELAGKKLNSIDEIVLAARDLLNYGIMIVVVTMGKLGALVVDSSNVYIAKAPEITLASALGSGDSFAAAFVDSILKDQKLSDALVTGIAAGTANACSYGAGVFDIEEMINIRNKIRLE